MDRDCDGDGDGDGDTPLSQLFSVPFFLCVCSSIDSALSSETGISS